MFGEAFKNYTGTIESKCTFIRYCNGTNSFYEYFMENIYGVPIGIEGLAYSLFKYMELEDKLIYNQEGNSSK